MRSPITPQPVRSVKKRNQIWSTFKYFLEWYSWHLSHWLGSGQRSWCRFWYFAWYQHNLMKNLGSQNRIITQLLGNQQKKRPNSTSWILAVEFSASSPGKVDISLHWPVGSCYAAFCTQMSPWWHSSFEKHKCTKDATRIKCLYALSHIGIGCSLMEDDIFM